MSVASKPDNPFRTRPDDRQYEGLGNHGDLACNGKLSGDNVTTIAGEAVEHA
jgi:hypothetical protein